jgi:hypothetical protein
MNLKDDYEFLNELGRGVNGIVWKVKRKSDDKLFAMKELAVGGSFIESFSEIDAGVRIEHPHIIHIEAMFSGDKKFYILLPLMDGIIEKYDLWTKTDAFRDRLAYELMSAINFLHINNMYHCDLKPDNIFMSKDGSLIVGDLGLVKYNTVDASTCNAIGYRPPELFIRDEFGARVDPRKYNALLKMNTSPEYKQKMEKLLHWKNVRSPDADMWSVGVIIWFLVTGKNPIFIGSGRGTNETQVFVNMSKMISGEYFVEDKDSLEYWLPLMKQMLNADPEVRLRSTTECFKFDVWKTIGYRDPIMGSIITKSPQRLMCDFGYSGEININAIEVSKYNLLNMESFFLGYTLFYRVNEQVWESYNADEDSREEIASTTIAACLFVAASVITGFTYKIKNFITGKTPPTKIVLKESIKKILQITKGVLVTDTLYTYAFSEKSVLDALDVLFDCKRYSYIDFRGYMLKKQQEETPEERQNRSPKENARLY